MSEALPEWLQECLQQATSPETTAISDAISSRAGDLEDNSPSVFHGGLPTALTEAMAECQPCSHLPLEHEHTTVIAHLSGRRIECMECLVAYVDETYSDDPGAAAEPTPCAFCRTYLEPPFPAFSTTVGQVLLIGFVCADCLPVLHSGLDLETFPDPGHYAAGGPVDLIWKFLHAVFEEHSWDACWNLMDTNLQRCRAQAWLWNNRTHPDVAGYLDELLDEFMADSPDDPLWDEFAKIELDQLIGSWQRLWDRELGAASHPRPISPDLELVILVPTDGNRLVFEGDTLVPDALPFTVRTTSDGLRIAAYGDFVPEPGWPPRLTPSGD